MPVIPDGDRPRLQMNERENHAAGEPAQAGQSDNPGSQGKRLLADARRFVRGEVGAAAQPGRQARRIVMIPVTTTSGHGQVLWRKNQTRGGD